MININTNHLPDNFRMLVSGGIDSIAAAHWLKTKFRRKFEIVHFNHEVQPETNHAMECAVERFCMDFDFTGHFLNRNVEETPAFSDDSEEGLRNWRLYKMQGFGGNFITAHHLNDAVENYLMNCFHGTPEHSPISWFTKFPNFTICHPFLRTSKKHFIEYVNDFELQKYVVEDPTNWETKGKRNWIRNVIVPSLNSRNMGIETIVRKKFYD